MLLPVPVDLTLGPLTAPPASSSPLETSGEDGPTYLSPLDKYNLWYVSSFVDDQPGIKWCPGGTTLETSGEDVKLHSKRVEKM
jgi:hypothetical protein